MFNGPSPIVQSFDSAEDESAAAALWLRAAIDGGALPREIGIFTRSEAQIERAKAAVATAGLLAQVLDDRIETRRDAVIVAPMHLAKGLEFRTVAVLACDDEVLPLQARIEEVGNGGDLLSAP